MRRTVLTLIVLFHFTGIAFSQQYPSTSNFYSNPFFYNPAIISENESFEVNLFYRKQWAGFTDAPSTQGFNVQMPLPKNLYFGVNFYHDKSVLLNASSFEAGIGYKVVFGEKSELKFGISAGIGTNRFEFDQVEDYVDPAIYHAVTNKYRMTGRFGLYYKIGNLALGASLPQIFKVNYLDTAGSRMMRMDQFQNYILSAKYTFNFYSSHTTFEPVMLYRKSEVLPGIFEIGGVFAYKSMFNIGVFYKTNIGMSWLLGLTIKEKLNFSYTYDLATGKYGTYGNGNHELNLRFRLKSKKTEKLNEWKSKIGNTSNRDRNASNQAKQADKNTTESASKSEDLTAMESEDGLDPNANYMHYVVIGAFKYRSNADRMMRRYHSSGLNTSLKYNPSLKLQYVYLACTKNLEKAKKSMKNLRNKFGFPDIWIYHEKI